MLFTGNYHNIVNWLYPNTKCFCVKKKTLNLKYFKLKKKKQNVVLEMMLQSPLDSKEIKPLNLKGTQPQIFIGRTDAKAEVPILWSPDAKNWRKTLMLG